MSKIKLAFNNLEEFVDLVYDNIQNITIKKEELKDIYDLNRWCYLDDVYASFMKWSYKEHNLLNGTYGKKNVPTIRQRDSLFHNIMYCPNCKQMHTDINYKGVVEFDSNMHYKMTIENIESFTCNKCDSEYLFDEVKFINSSIEYIGGDVFIDEHKISIAFKYLYNSVNRHSQIYYDDGYVRLTFNTKTGYSYTTNKGHAYKELKRTWERYGLVPPVTFNSTYTMFDGTEGIFNSIVQCKKITEYKQMNREELIAAFKHIDKEGSLNYRRQQEQVLIQHVVKELYQKVQQNFHYKLPQYILNAGKKQYHYIARMCKIFNRYVNVNAGHHNMHLLLDKEFMFKKNKIHREEVNIINALFAAENTKIGKKTRALVQQNLYHKDLFDLLPILLCFKNSSNINTLVNAVLDGNHTRLRHSFTADIANAVKLWLNYRDENYIVAQILNEMKNEPKYSRVGSVTNEEVRTIRNKKSRVDLMRDSFYMIRRMQDTLKTKDLDINEICVFRNEQQFHDDIMRFMNSDEYQDLIIDKESSIVFDLEEEMLALENTDKNIFVARNGGELRKIGRQMNICVGSYTESVVRGSCRIVYIMAEDNKTYKACIELRPNKTKNKTTYTLVQAKLKFNRRPCEDMAIYNKIKEWTELHNIAIVTYDMELPDVKTIFKQEVHAI